MISKLFIPIGVRLKRFYPSLEKFIIQSGMKTSPEEIISKAISYSIIYGIVTFICFLFITKKVGISSIIGFTISVMFYFYELNIPRLKAERKRRDLEKKLMFAVDQMVIKLKSGVPLFDTMKSIAKADYGILSDEFAKVVKKIESGEDEGDALREMATTSPSPYLRKIAWEMTSSIKSGGNIADVLEGISSNLSKEDEIKMKAYNGVLNVYLLVYMITSIVIPALFIIASLVISMISSYSIPGYFFFLVPLFIGTIEFMIIGLIKARRPPVWEE